ncbi:DUF4241 domain-containing protein [Mesorhizobium sp. LSHC422A00]|uniref:DUF4241 domain-containing protein n=1 Tax=Mesorhizobium sp. LSHC422A00 TaxID=1287294 RepID=UPI002477E319|nr:DUF4241 domain-containing protein [Mesorhizobium sp. LSHC422A00]
MGELELPTGEIIACDPLITGLERPVFSRKVRPGCYPVTLLEAQGRVAAAVLRFGTGLPVRSWLPSSATSAHRPGSLDLLSMIMLLRSWTSRF